MYHEVIHAQVLKAPSLGKPVPVMRVMRDIAERPEAVEVGTVKLIATPVCRISSQIIALLTDQVAYNAMSFAHNLYGDDKTCQRIRDFLVTSHA